jgi:hypothetical protein
MVVGLAILFHNIFTLFPMLTNTNWPIIIYGEICDILLGAIPVQIMMMVFFVQQCHLTVVGAVPCKCGKQQTRTTQIELFKLQKCQNNFGKFTGQVNECR